MNYIKNQNIASIFFLMFISQYGYADDISEQALPTVTVKQKRLTRSDNLLKGRKTSDRIIKGEQFRSRGSTIGEALNQELGIHANSFGAGASAPIIRGQEGKRIRVLHNHAETGDMSNMSPDHAVMVDSILAKQIEVLRGTPTLLYSSGNSAGVVNVIDNKIPTKLPEKGYEGEVGARVSSANLEKLTAGGITFGLGKNFAVHAEGMYQKADNYRVPYFSYGGQTHKRVPDTWAKSRNGSLGFSWLGERGYLGAAYSERQDRYGLPAHTHKYDNYSIDILWESRRIMKRYLRYYPFLADESDIDFENPGLSLNHTHIPGESHADEAHDHTHGRAWIDLKSKRYDLRGELKQPFKGFDLLRTSISYTDYRHDEKDGKITENFFKNKGYNARLEFVHKPIGNWQGMFGVQHNTQKSSAFSPASQVAPKGAQQLLHDNRSTQTALFGIEQYQGDKHGFEVGFRAEKQKIAIDYDIDLIKENNSFNFPLPNLNPHKEKAYSFAASYNWYFAPKHQLSITASHLERIPNSQELYAHGKHIATNSFEVGNKDLTKERSNNFEIGVKYSGSKWDYNVNAYYNHFSNYIYLLTMNDGRGPKSLDEEFPLQVNRYYQAGARFYGLETAVGYRFNPKYKLTVFGDYVNGKLVNIPKTGAEYDWWDEVVTKWREHPDRPTPRLPPLRLGMRLDMNFNDKWQASLDFHRMFSQNKTSYLEQPTKGHNMLNADLSYQNKYKGLDYKIYGKADNLLNAKVYRHATFLPYIPQTGRNFTAGVNIRF